MSDQVVWVFDGALGHLAIGHRGGLLAELVGRKTVHFLRPYEALPYFHRNGRPDAILVGSTSLGELVDLLSLPELEAVPVLLSHHQTPKDLRAAGMQLTDLPSNVEPNLDSDDTIQSVTRFVRRHLRPEKSADKRFRYRHEGD